MSDADVRAIAVYLKSLPAGAPEPAVSPPPQADMAAGAAVYAHACIACHEVGGEGTPRIYPPLPGNANLQSADPASTLRIILDGAQTVTTPRAPNTGSMPAYAKDLSDQQIADVTDYVRNAWSNAAPVIDKTGLVGAIRADTVSTISGPGAIEEQNNPCLTSEYAAPVPRIDDPQIRKTLEEITPLSMLPTIPTLIARVREISPKLSQADIVNGLTLAY